MHIENMLEQFDAKEYISNFQIDLFSTCPASYFYLYTFQQKNKNPMTTFGDCIHTVIERVSRECIEKHSGLIAAVNFEFVMQAFKKVIETFPEIITLDNFKRGEKQLYYWYTKAVERECRVLSVEIPFHLCLPNGIWIKGFIDSEETNKYTIEGEVQFADWKTGFLSKDHTNQMTLYKIAGLLLRPNQTITTVLHELEHETYEIYDITKKDMEDYYVYVEVIKNAINVFVDKVNTILKEEDVKKLKSFLDSVAKTHNYCYSCAGNIACGTYKTELYGFTPAANLESLNIDQLVLQEKQLKRVAKWADESLKKIKALFIDQLLKNDMRPLPLDSGEYINPASSSRQYFESTKVIPILIQHGYQDKLTMSMTGLREIIPNLPESDQDKINKSIHKTIGNPSYRVSKKPKDKL